MATIPICHFPWSSYKLNLHNQFLIVCFVLFCFGLDNTQYTFVQSNNRLPLQNFLNEQKIPIKRDNSCTLYIHNAHKIQTLLFSWSLYNNKMLYIIYVHCTVVTQIYAYYNMSSIRWEQPGVRSRIEEINIT